MSASSACASVLVWTLGADVRGFGGEARRVARRGDSDVDAVTGKCLGQGLADLPETDDCVAHVFFSLFDMPDRFRRRTSGRPGARRQSCARPPSTATSLAVMKLLSEDARKAAAAAISDGSAMRSRGVIAP